MPAERIVQAFEVSEPSESASCALVEDAIWSVKRGVEVPRPKVVRLSFQKKLEALLESDVPLENWTEPDAPLADEPPTQVPFTA